MKKLSLIILSLLILLCACSHDTDSSENTCMLYYFDTENDNRLIPTTERLSALTVEDSVNEAFLKLKTTENKNLSPVITPDIKLSSLSVSDNICEIELSSRYTKLPASSKAAVDACLVKTICSIGSIERVKISCENVLISDFTERDFLIESPRTYYDVYTVNLYFANVEFDGLRADRETISLSPDTTLERAVISRLLTAVSSDKLQNAIPAGTKLNNVYVSEGMCYVDLSHEFVENAVHDEIHESLAIYSIVNTMTELPMINSVKFLIDGNDAGGYTYYKLSGAFTNNSELILK